MSIKKYYVDCYRLRATETLNDKLTPIVTYVETSIKGYIGSKSSNIVKVADKETIETRYNFFCNDFNLKNNDLIKYENNTYEVVDDPKNTAHKNHHIKVLIRKVDNIKQH